MVPACFDLTAMMMLGTFPSLANTCNENGAQQEMCQYFQKSVQTNVRSRLFYWRSTDLQSADSFLVPDNVIQL